jgi:hypothetical protein
MTLRSFERRVRWLAGSPRLYSKSQSCGICSGGYAEPHHHAASVHLETARNRKRGDFDIAWFYITRLILKTCIKAQYRVGRLHLLLFGTPWRGRRATARAGLGDDSRASSSSWFKTSLDAD